MPMSPPPWRHAPRPWRVFQWCRLPGRVYAENRRTCAIRVPEARHYSGREPANEVVLGEMWWVAKMWYFAVPFSMTAKRALAIALGRHRKRSQHAAPPPRPGVRRSRIVNSASRLHRAEDHR